MDVSVSIDEIPSAPGLLERVLDEMNAANPVGEFRRGPSATAPHRLHIGFAGLETSNAGLHVAGAGWTGYCGAKPVPFPASRTNNLLGPGLAAILAAAHVFYERGINRNRAATMNALDWTESYRDGCMPSFDRLPRAPELMFVGAGSVGTATAYFLAESTARFTATTIDGDTADLVNVARSPIFDAESDGLNKSLLLARWLHHRGIDITEMKDSWLGKAWLDRELGTPDLLVTAANEHGVRSLVENGYPPVQIYATTGANNQVTVVRHIPGIDPCSLCLFPEQEFVATKCATGDADAYGQKRPDAALPFLSYLAGLMASAEILKLAGGLSTGNRHIVTLEPSLHISRIPLSHRDGCICATRSPSLHGEAVGSVIWPNPVADRESAQSNQVD
ncbi:MAG: ThiF family adenylyltransferase [Gammaproteobacteria bacterium]